VNKPAGMITTGDEPCTDCSCTAAREWSLLVSGSATAGMRSAGLLKREGPAGAGLSQMHVGRVIARALGYLRARLLNRQDRPARAAAPARK
jgi:hypothetical protein